MKGRPQKSVEVRKLVIAENHNEINEINQ